MIQKARGADSRSFLRELEYAILMLDNENDEEYFQKRFKKVIAKRNDPSKTYTDATAVRRELLAKLSQLGEIATVNVWARHLTPNSDNIAILRKTIAEALRENNLYGIVEIHPQDREILSPHIQFVGIRAEEAELIIAQIVVDLGFELSLESAMSKNHIPNYEYQDVEVLDLAEQIAISDSIDEFSTATDELDARADELESTQEFMKRLHNEFLQALSEFSDDILEGIIDRKELEKELESAQKPQEPREIVTYEQVSKMSDDELEKHISYLQDKAERFLRRIK